MRKRRWVFPKIPSQSAAIQAKRDVLERAGATVPARSRVDLRVIDTVREKSGAARLRTAVWNKDLKQMLDERIMRHIGIPAERCWDWTPGQVVHDTEDWYPEMPGYGLFLDPLDKINGQIVRGGPGWVVMSARISTGVNARP